MNLVRHQEDFDLNDVNLLKVGWHFWLSPEVKAVVGRNNGRMRSAAKRSERPS